MTEEAIPVDDQQGFLAPLGRTFRNHGTGQMQPLIFRQALPLGGKYTLRTSNMGTGGDQNVHNR